MPGDDFQSVRSKRSNMVWQFNRSSILSGQDILMQADVGYPLLDEFDDFLHVFIPLVGLLCHLAQ